MVWGRGPWKVPFASHYIKGPCSRPDGWLLTLALTLPTEVPFIRFSTVTFSWFSLPFPALLLGRKSPRKPHVGRGDAPHLLVAGRYINRLGIVFMGNLSLLPSLFICSSIYLISTGSWIFILTLDYNPIPPYLFYRSNGSSFDRWEVSSWLLGHFGVAPSW